MMSTEPRGAEPERTFGFLVHDVARLMSKKFDQRAREHRLSLAQCKCLAYIHMNEGIHQAGLADLLEIEPISLARLVDRMAAAGWIERKPDPADRRAWRLLLTEQAHPIFEQIKAIAADMREIAFIGLTHEETGLLTDLLKRVHANLSERDMSAAETRKAAKELKDRELKAHEIQALELQALELQLQGSVK